MSLTYLEAIRAAQARALAEDSRVFIYGQDVGTFGGAFKATKNLAQEYPGRVIDSPISEDAMVGAAIGAAIEGMRPIIEMQFADFSTVGFNQIVNQAAIEKLPLVLVVADNQYAYSTPNSRQFACASLADKAEGYGVHGHSVDGTDLGACLRVLKEAVARARAGLGPQMVFARLLRLCGHGEHDDAHYIDPKLKQSPLGRDCLKVAEENLLRQKWADPAALDSWRHDATQKVEEAVARAKREPAPDPFKEDWYALSSKHLHEGHGDE